MRADPQISVVIPTYQRRGSVERVLEALARQTLPHDAFEVIVSIDGSDDGTGDMVTQYHAAYTLRALWQPNRGRAAACNAGIRTARGDVIVLLDDDMEPAPGCLAGHLAAHPAGSRHAVVGAAPIRFDAASPPVVEFMGIGFDWRLRKLGEPGHVMTFRETYTGNFSVRRDVVLEVGAFDEGFTAYGHEDYELALRLERAGVRLTFSREALAHQHYEKSYAALARNAVARGRTAVFFAMKHPEVADRLKLATYAQGSRKWHTARRALLACSRVYRGTPDAVIRLVTWLERWRPRRLRRYYELSLDYFFWLGVRSAARGVTPAVGLSTSSAPASHQL
jgi:glycosyltransferase involved in cell wall biosynthesis